MAPLASLSLLCLPSSLAHRLTVSPRDPLAASLIKPLSPAGGWPPPYLGVHHEGEENEGEGVEGGGEEGGEGGRKVCRGGVEEEKGMK